MTDKTEGCFPSFLALIKSKQKRSGKEYMLVVRNEKVSCLIFPDRLHYTKK